VQRPGPDGTIQSQLDGLHPLDQDIEFCPDHTMLPITTTNNVHRSRRPSSWWLEWMEGASSTARSKNDTVSNMTSQPDHGPVSPHRKNCRRCALQMGWMILGLSLSSQWRWIFFWEERFVFHNEILRIRIESILFYHSTTGG
jgi:hypothetical protein